MQLTNYAENKLCDMIRGQALVLPTSWYVALGSAASDSAFAELAGTDYGREAYASGLGSWSSPAGASHTTRNVGVIDFGLVGAGGWGMLAAVGLYDAPAGGNCWMWADRDAQLLNAADAFSIPGNGLAWTLGLSGGMTDYLAAKLLDRLFRNVAFAWPASMYAALFTAAPSNAGPGADEVVAPSYGRPALVCTQAAISGTQGAGSTTASSGTAGLVSNNAALPFPAPAEAWGTCTHGGWFDAPVAGNLLFWGPLAAAKTIGAGGTPPRFDPAQATFTFA